MTLSDFSDLVIQVILSESISFTKDKFYENSSLEVGICFVKYELMNELMNFESNWLFYI